MFAKSFCILIFLGMPFFTMDGIHGADRIELIAGGDRNETGILATQAKLKEPFGVEFDPNHELWIIEMTSGNRLLQVDAKGILHHRAGMDGNGFEGDGGVPLKAMFNGPHNLAIEPSGRILIADTWNGRVRTMDPAVGRVDSLAGFQVPLDKARNSGPYCISLDPSGEHLYIADLKRIHRVHCKTGVSQVVAGNGEKGIPKDGAIATQSPLVDPRAVAVDGKGNIYILERNGNALRVVRPDGSIQTVVNATGAKGTFRSNVETAIDAMLNGPKHLCIDEKDRVVIADAENHLIRRYDPADSTLRRIAGTGKSGSQGVGGDPIDCQLARPHGVTVHPKTHELYITDSYNHRILKMR